MFKDKTNDNWEKFLQTGNITDYVKHKKYIDKVARQQEAETSKIGDQIEEKFLEKKPRRCCSKNE